MFNKPDSGSDANSAKSRAELTNDKKIILLMDKRCGYQMVVLPIST